MKTINVNAGIEVHSAITCYLCGAEGSILYGRLRDRLFGAPGEWDLKKCSNSACGLVWLDPLPTETDLHKVYTAYYTHQATTGQFAHAGASNLLRRKVRSVLRMVYHRLLHLTGLSQARFSIATMYLVDDKPGKLLEVGCGSGAFLDRMRSRGWYVQGIEVDAKAAKVARETFGVPVYVGSLEKASYPNASFDAITMNHVIEHVHDPIALLEECHRVLSPGGHLVVVTPNVRSLGHAQFGQNWLALDPPRHLHLFSASTLEAIARRALYQQIETWTTPANAEGIALASIDIQYNRRHTLGSPQPISRKVMSRYFQWQALAHHWKHQDSGEEVVLKAGK
jgi:2-polyprenyl-3-methyl-5-hydroxy-6-metoxy-1,4-benzoquinol methylase